MTYANLRSIVIGSFVLAAAGCGDKAPGDGDTGSEAGTGGSTTGPDTGTTTDPATSTTTGEMPTTSAAASETATTGDPSSGSTSTGEVSGTTTGGGDCNLMDQAAAAAAEGDGEVDDCGVVTPEDPAPTWQAAHDCVLAAVAEQRSFTLITPLPGADGEVAQGYVGIAGQEYVTEALFFEGDPCGDGSCGARVFRGICGDSLVATDNCTVEPSAVCLTCAAQGDILGVCG